MRKGWLVVGNKLTPIFFFPVIDKDKILIADKNGVLTFQLLISVRAEVSGGLDIPDFEFIRLPEKPA